MKITSLDLPKATKVGDYFLFYNRVFTTLNLSELTEVGEYFLNNNPQHAPEGMPYENNLPSPP